MEKLRQEIEKTDREIIKLLNKRFGIVKRIADHKLKIGKSVRDSKREKELIQKYVSKNKDKKFITDLFKIIINKSIKIQNERHNSKIN